MSPVLARVVYIVDTDDPVRQGLARLLDSASREGKPCESIDALLREPLGPHAACVLLDVSDSRLHEPAVRSQVRALAATVPVIALSARDDAEVRRVARALGARAFFRKPVDAAALLDSIDWVTEGGDIPG
jgi:FixJ family two-component response regulator